MGLVTILTQQVRLLLSEARVYCSSDDAADLQNDFEALPSGANHDYFSAGVDRQMSSIDRCINIYQPDKALGLRGIITIIPIAIHLRAFFVVVYCMTTSRCISISINYASSRTRSSYTPFIKPSVAQPILNSTSSQEYPYL